MEFISQAAAGVVLVALTLSLQSAGMAALIHWARAFLGRSMQRFGVCRSALLMVRFTSVIVILHLLQILLWAGFYRWNCLRSWEPALYFSMANYSTVGAGDVLLPHMWRSLGALESITGVLMCGLSASFLFALVLRLVERETRFISEWTKPGGDRVRQRS